MGNLEVIHTGTSILYDWDVLGSSICIVDILRIDDLRFDDQSSILRSSIYRVFKNKDKLKEKLDQGVHRLEQVATKCTCGKSR